MEKEKKEFNVSDKRKFDEKGNLKEQFKEDKKTKPAEKKASTAKKKSTTQSSQKKPKENFKQKVPLTQEFSTFILSLSSSAYIYLGILEDPVNKEKKVNLESAKQMIDIIAMLKEKTKGNLTPNEQQLLDSILYELQMQYLSKSNIIKS
jgi:flagellar basal body-associated protein FliL